MGTFGSNFGNNWSRTTEIEQETAPEVLASLSSSDSVKGLNSTDSAKILNPTDSKKPLG